MEIECKEIEYCKLQVHYEADSDVVAEKRNESTNKLKDLKIPGFRKGKAPLEVLKSKFKKDIDEWVKREMLAVAYDDVVFETKIKPIGYPQCLTSNLAGTKFVCDLIFLKKPEFELKDYKEIEVPKPHQPMKKNEMAEQIIQDLRVKFGDPTPYEDDDFVEKGDKVTMDLVTKINDEVLDDASKMGMLYEVGSQASFAELDDNLMGMAPGDEREFNMALPESFGEYAGKEATITVTVHMGMKVAPAPLDDELAKKAGCENYEDLRTKATMAAESKIQSVDQALIANQLTKKLVAAHDFEVPSWLISMETQQLASRNGIKAEEISDDMQEQYRENAIENVKFALILDSIREAEPEAALTEQEAAETVKRQLMQRTPDAEQIFVEAQKNGQLVGMIANLKNQFTLQWLTGQAKLVE